MENEDLTRLLVFVLAVDTYRDLIKDPSCTPLQALEYAMDLYEKCVTQHVRLCVWSRDGPK